MVNVEFSVRSLFVRDARVDLSEYLLDEAQGSAEVVCLVGGDPGLDQRLHKKRILG